ncbi:imidazole glycerol phosphate synthase subunit HisH [Vibrio coralliilyticus]|uniref:imidazole glycerol phosphate synthase subunit HisH n=1 Tax=Vibrio coralliilyticus TaxID=190893 RepID=UPI000BAB0AF0|nr:imidazole glycerol phosphate synthase subunit HisH [Vibrio coralliilyticus]NOI60403.1 imidazole glycerol phosphate synthase subunit HisH [Vibrio coralliilyticus]PAT67402.1 imidazole glycerol phosphate synthase subunit HisH [Vibrio coralliilyticus]
MKIGIIDYGMGNISSLISALNYLGYDDVEISHDYQVLQKASKLILPGVGNYAEAALQLDKLGLNETLKSLVIEQKKPILGICLGMQILGISSTESGYNDGLCFIDGRVEKFTSKSLKIPHVGYNQIAQPQDSILFAGIDDCSDFYFTHSFRMMSDSDIRQSICEYGESFVASFEVDNIAGVQFHPELSQNNGLKLINNFLEHY